MKVKAAVPRGTQLWPVKLSEVMARAVISGLKTTHRIPIEQANSAILTPGSYRFDLIDWASGRPQDEKAHKHWDFSLLCRVLRSARDWRSIEVGSQVREGDLLWMQRRGTAKNKEAHTLMVRMVWPERLQEIGCAGALSEGIAIHGVPLKGTSYRLAYETLLSEMGKALRTKWNATALHEELTIRQANARDVFALDWVMQHGFLSWVSNPWVWGYEFVVLNTAPPIAKCIPEDSALGKLARAKQQKDAADAALQKNWGESPLRQRAWDAEVAYEAAQKAFKKEASKYD